MTSNMFARYTDGQTRMILATMPTIGVVEYDDTPILSRIPAEQLTGKAWRERQQEGPINAH